jgi:hypothetical protein
MVPAHARRFHFFHFSLSLRSLQAAQAIALSTSPFSKHSGLPPHNALDDDDATCAVILLNGFRNLTQSGSWISLLG